MRHQGDLIAAREMRRNLLSQTEVMLCVARPDLPGVARKLETVRRIVPDRFEHAEPGDNAGSARANQGLLDQVGERFDDVRADLGTWTADRFNRFQVPSSGEYRKAREQPPLGLLEQLVAPADRFGDRSLSIRQVPQAGSR